MKFYVCLSFLILSFLGMKAQSYSEEVQKAIPGEGTVIIYYQDPSLRILVDGVAPKKAEPKPEPKHETKPIQKKATQQPPKETHKETVHERTALRKTNEDTNRITVQEDDADQQYRNKVYSRSYTTNGYRIQIYSGNNSREANRKAIQMAYLFKASFPNIPVYTHFYSPRWISRAGNFKSYGEAQTVLNQLKADRTFSGATIVKSKIQVGVSNGK